MPTSRHPFVAAPGAPPLVVGHRGVPRLHQENTVAGFRRAISLGVPALELDVLLSRDRVPVVVHDAELTRLTGEPGVVARMSWDEIARRRLRRELPMGIDASGQSVLVRYDRSEPIARLDEVLAEVGTTALNIELKVEAGAWWRTDVGAIVARAISAAGASDTVIVSSFDVRKLAAAKRVCSDLLLAFAYDDGMLNFAGPVFKRLPPLARVDPRLLDDPRPHGKARLALSRLVEGNWVGKWFGTGAVGVEHTLIGPSTVERLRAGGSAIGTHTLLPLGSTTGKAIPRSASSRSEVLRLAELGVDWIESDDPIEVMEILASR